MILGRPLTEAEGAASRRNFLFYSVFNGFSYSCLGETVILLFAVRLQCPDYLTAMLGGMLYAGFVMLPLGRRLAAGRGAVNCQADCWVCRNLAALLVALAAPAVWCGYPVPALIFLFLGAFLFYGFRAAGIVMSQPLFAEISASGGRGRLLSASLLLNQISSVAALLLVTFITGIRSGLWVLAGIIVLGAAAGLISTFFIRRICETGDICRSAAQPVWRLWPQLRRDPWIRPQLIAGMIANFCVILTMPLSMLALKQGYGVSDAVALIYYLIQQGAAILYSSMMVKYSDRLGGRKLTLLGYAVFFAICLFWLAAPRNFSPLLLAVPFILCGIGPVGMVNALQLYFLNTVRKKFQVAAGVIIAVATGVFSGLLGMAVSSSLLKFSGRLAGGGMVLTVYRLYFLLVLALLPVLGIFVWRLPRERGAAFRHHRKQLANSSN